MNDHEQPGQLRLLADDEIPHDVISGAFDAARLTQARRLAGLTKKTVADTIGVSPVAVGQWEAGTASPRPDNVEALAKALEVPVSFLASGRPYARLDSAAAHFRSLRRTPAIQRSKAVAFTEQLWELTNALEKRVRLPAVDLPGFSAGEVEQLGFPTDPIGAAGELRKYWGLGLRRIPRVVRTMEQHGIIVTLAPFNPDDAKTIDAFSTTQLPRPVVVLTRGRADDVYRHRFTAAHELGHLVMHGNCVPGDPLQEKEADIFAAEFLTPKDQISPELPARIDFNALIELSATWGVSVDSLLRRCKEVGMASEATYRRAYQRLAALRDADVIRSEPIEGFPGEVPTLLRSAYEVAEQNGLSLKALAAELRITLPRLRLLLGEGDTRPTLHLV
ncbi:MULTISPECIES: helix-turn-helix domain-containing protein [Rhodococcus]|uniref:XRE family transcriptional regulator n=1 Tax=Rhodococcus qingshengii JCM 15477 TaxID=1303681 RepID=A0AB38R5R2_RHOSG|nr:MULTISPECIES: XRE family transcriptional regulator [Rhodococcus]MCD2131393.1 XRE family transcriptional regulator [Rhodococcus qingshengii]UPU40811.1 XRE family transcriptional regulator [Rhodococcus qingshengii JCM 15477]